MGQNSSTSAFQKSSQPFFQQRRSNLLASHNGLLSAEDQLPINFSPASNGITSIPNGEVEFSRFQKPESNIPHDYHSDYANRSLYRQNSDFYRESQVSPAQCQENSFNKENSLPSSSSSTSSQKSRETIGLNNKQSPWRYSMTQDTTRQDYSMTQDTTRQDYSMSQDTKQAYIQNGMKYSNNNGGKDSLHFPTEERESSPARQPMERNSQLPKNNATHKRQTSVASRHSLHNSPILEDSREHLYNPARNEPFSTYQPSSTSLPVKSTFGIDHSLNLTYAQLAEYRRSKRMTELTESNRSNWQELEAEIMASSMLPKSPFEHQNLGSKSSTRSISTASSSTGLSSSKKKRAPAPPTQATIQVNQIVTTESIHKPSADSRLTKSVNQPSTDSRITESVHQPLTDSRTKPPHSETLLATEKLVQRTISSASGSSKPQAPEPPPNKSNVSDNIQSSASSFTNSQTLAKTGAAESSVMTLSNSDKYLWLAASAPASTQPYDKAALQACLEQARRQLAAIRKLQDKFQSEEVTDKSTHVQDNIDDVSKVNAEPVSADMITSISKDKISSFSKDISSGRNDTQNSASTDNQSSLGTDNQSTGRSDIPNSASTDNQSSVRNNIPNSVSTDNQSSVRNDIPNSASTDIQSSLSKSSNTSVSNGSINSMSIDKTSILCTDNYGSVRDDIPNIVNSDCQSSLSKVNTEEVKASSDLTRHPSIQSEDIKAIKDLSKRPSIQSVDMILSSSNASQRVFSPDWTPEHDLDSEDDIMDDKHTVTERRASCEGFKSTSRPLKIQELGSRKKEKNNENKTKTERSNETKEEGKTKFGSIRRLKKSVHESMRSAFGSISRASSKLMKKQKINDVLDDTKSAEYTPALSEINLHKVNKYGSWGTFHSYSGSLHRAASDVCINDPSENGINDNELFMDSDDDIADIDFAYGINDIPVKSQQILSERDMKELGVGYVSSKGHRLLLSDYQTVQPDEYAHIVRNNGHIEGHAVKVARHKHNIVTQKSMNRGRDKSFIEETLTRQILEKEKLIEEERQKQREIERKLQQLHDLEAEERQQRAHTQNMQEQIHLLHQLRLQQVHHKFSSTSSVYSSNNLNLFSVSPQTNTLLAGQQSDKTLSSPNLLEPGTLTTDDHCLNQSVYIGNSMSSGSYQRHSMPNLFTVIPGQSLSDMTNTTHSMNGELTPTLSSAEMSYLSQHMSAIGVPPPANNLEWAALLYACSLASTATSTKGQLLSQPTINL